MNVKKITNRFLSIILIVVVVISANFSSAIKVNAASTVVVDPAKQYQTLEGWGTSLCWWGNEVGNWADLNKRNEISDLLFNAQNGLGLNIVRYNIGGGENPSHEHMRVSAEVPGYEPTEGVWDWNADAGQRWVLQSSINRGANILEAFTNAPPYWMTYSKCSAGATSGAANNLYDDSYDNFADYITDVLKHFKDYWGITFRTVSPLNEPISTWWASPNNQEGSHFDRDKQNLLIREVGLRLEQKGLSGTSVGAPEEYSIDQSITSFNELDTTSKGYISQINTHTYSGSNRGGLRDTATTNGKKLWVSEVGIGGTEAHNHQDMTSTIQIADQIRNDLKDMQANAWVYWQAVENEAGNNNYGFIHANFTGTEQYWLTKQYYGMANYSKFIRPGFKVIDIGAQDSLAAFDTVNNKLVIVTTNSSSSDRQYTFDLSKFTSVGQTVSSYRTSATEDLVQLTNTQVTNKSFTAVAKANSVTTYVIDGTAYTGWTQINDTKVGIGDNQFNYSGNWNYYGSQQGAYYSDNHYSTSTNDTYKVNFFGTKAKLYGALNVNHGIAAVSIDNGPETMVDLYSTSRQDQALIYTSANLTPGQHTIKVRVTGSKNSSSSGTAVISDRVDIINESTLQPTPTPTPTSVPLNDIALGKSVTADSSQSGNDEKKANDGSLATRWCANDANLNHWWKVDLGAASNITGSQIAFGTAAKYRIEGSSDGTSWTTLVDKTNNSNISQVQKDNYTASNIRYVRVTITGLQSGAWASIDEFKVFGTSFATINDNTTGNMNNQFEYSGNWGYNWYENSAFLSDNHYSSNTGDYYIVRFNGTQLKLYGATDKSLGIAGISIDGGPETNVDLYSLNRIGNTIIYTSPVLTYGQHVLKVRVTGTKNSSSTGNSITADRVDVKY